MGLPPVPAWGPPHRALQRDPPREGPPDPRAAWGRSIPPQSQLWGALMWPEPFGAVPVL